MSIVKSSSLSKLQDMDRKCERPSSEDMMTDEIAHTHTQNPRKKDSVAVVGVAALEQLPLVPVSEDIVKVPESVAYSNDSLQQWMRHASEHGDSVHAQLVQVKETVQKYYRDNIADHENSVDPSMLNQLNEERSNLCKMVVVSCREIEALRTQLINQANVAEMTAQEKQTIITHTQRVFAEAHNAQQKYAQMEAMFNNVANHILSLQQERDHHVQENILLQASMRALDFHRSQEVAGVTSQLEQQTAELSSVKAQYANDAATLTNALKDMERQYGNRIHQLDTGSANDRAKAEAHIVQLRSEAAHAIKVKDAQIRAQEDQLKAEQYSVSGLKSELSSIMNNFSVMQKAMMEQKAEFTHQFAELSAANSRLMFEKSITHGNRPHSPEPKMMYMPWMDPLSPNTVVESQTEMLKPSTASMIAQPLSAEENRKRTEALMRNLASQMAGSTSSTQPAPASSNTAEGNDSVWGAIYTTKFGKSQTAANTGDDTGGNDGDDDNEDRKKKREEKFLREK